MDRIIVISFHLNKQRSFNYGQIYVTISRSKTLQGILEKLSASMLEQIVKYMKNMKY